MSKCIKCGQPLPSEGDCAACAQAPLAGAGPRPPAVPRLLDRELHLDRRRGGARDAGAPRWAVGGALEAAGAAPAAAFALADALPAARNVHADALVADVLAAEDDDAFPELDAAFGDGPLHAEGAVSPLFTGALRADVEAAAPVPRTTPPYGVPVAAVPTAPPPAAAAPARRPLRERLQAVLAGTEPAIGAPVTAVPAALPAWAEQREVPPGLRVRPTPAPLPVEQPAEPAAVAPAADLSWVEAAARAAMDAPLMLDVTAARPFDVEQALARDADLAAASEADDATHVLADADDMHPAALDADVAQLVTAHDLDVEDLDAASAQAAHLDAPHLELLEDDAHAEPTHLAARQDVTDAAAAQWDAADAAQWDAADAAAQLDSADAAPFAEAADGLDAQPALHAAHAQPRAPELDRDALLRELTALPSEDAHAEDAHAEDAAAHPVVDPALPRPAPLWRRTAAFTVDALAVAGVVGLYLGVAAGVAWAGPRATLAESGLSALLLPGLALALVLSLAYCALSALVGRGRTLGRWLLGLRVVDAEGEAPRTGRALARALLSTVSVGLFLGGIWLALFDRRGQTLHDKLTSTFVVQPS